MDLKAHIRDVKDFPKPGIVFKDICPLLDNPEAFKYSAEKLAENWPGVTKVAGIESRGFIFGVLVAQILGVGFVPVRKKGKLPADTIELSYALEYGEDTIEIHSDAVSADDKVLVIDDLLATGGTLGAACSLIEKAGASVLGCAVVIELAFLEGRKKLGDHKLRALIEY